MSRFSVTGTVTSEPRIARSGAGVPFCGFWLVEDAGDAPASNPLRLDVIARGSLATTCARVLDRDRRVEVGGYLGQRMMRRDSFSYPVFSVIADAVRPLDARPAEPPMARVVHCRQDPYDIYIGRGRCPRTGVVGRLGNPYSHRPSKVPGVIVVGSAHEAVECHERWLWEQIKSGAITLDELAELHGKTLGCWCMEVCHGPTLARAAAWAWRRLRGIV